MADEKFSQFVTQGSISTGNTLVGLSSGINVQFNPFAFADDLTISTLTVGQGNFKDSFGTNGAFGSSALGSNVSGSNNSAFGYASLSAVSAGGANSAFGSGSGQSNDGINNVYVGFNSGALLGVTANGDNNVFLGSYSGNGGGNVSGYDMQAGSHNTFVGVFATGNSTTINGSIAIGYFSVSDAATGSTSGTFGPGIAFGASGFPVGFRGDGTAIPAGSQHYWRMKVNDTYYQIPLITDAAALLWPASGTLATTGQLPNQSVDTGSSPTFVGLTLSSALKGVTAIDDASSHPYIAFTSTASAVNYFQIQNAATSNYPTMLSNGTDTNIGFAFSTKAAGEFVFLSESTGTIFQVSSGAGYQHLTELAFPSTANSTVISFPDADGTILLNASVSGQIISGGLSFNGGSTVLNSSTGTGSFVGSNTPTLTTPVLNGIPTGTGVSTTSAASTLILRDSNQNAFANNFISKAINVSSAGTTTTLTAASARVQNLTGSSNQTFKLPDATTLSVGSSWYFNNNSTGVLSVIDNGSNTICTVPSGGEALVTAIVTVVANGLWDSHFLIPSNGAWGTAALTAPSIITTPAVSATSTLSIGTSYQNTLGYDVILIAYLDIASATTASIQCGVGPTITPTQQTIIGSITTATDVFIPVTVYLPNNYYVKISTTGTISASVSGQQVTPV